MKSLHFVGIGGSGMSSLACIAKENNYTVTGSDRNNIEPLPKILKHLQNQNITLFPQDGSGITEQTSAVVISTAIEESNPDLMKARQLNIPVIHRSMMLAEFFNNSKGIAVGGTNGKTTVSGMISFVLTKRAKDPSYILGGEINNYRLDGLGSYRIGKSPLMVIEADESDGSIVNYRSSIAVINNISRDHKELDELFELFNEFSSKSKNKTIINADCPNNKSIFKTKNTVSFGIENEADFMAKDIELKAMSSDFYVHNVAFTINLPGIHNVYNALTTIATLKTLGLELNEISSALSEFKGMHRRMEIISQTEDLTVIDDFAHNPAKIEATLKTLKNMNKRIIAFFQPHGFGPTKFMRNDYISVFSKYLSKDDFLFMPEIFYRGGTASKDISSKDLIDCIAKEIPNSFFIPSRNEITEEILKKIKKDDIVIIMGARDNTLTDFAGTIAKKANALFI